MRLKLLPFLYIWHCFDLNRQMYKCFHYPGSLGFSKARAQEAYNSRETKEKCEDRDRPIFWDNFIKLIQTRYCHPEFKLLTCYYGLLENLNKCLSIPTSNSSFASNVLTGPDMRNDDPWGLCYQEIFNRK